MPALLWTVRIVLLVMVAAAHLVVGATGSAQHQRAAGGIRKKKATGSSYASRTMYWSGPIILAFVIYHLLDFTFGNSESAFRAGRRLRQRGGQLPGDSGGGVLHPRHAAAVPASLSRHVEHVSIARASRIRAIRRR